MFEFGNIWMFALLPLPIIVYLIAPPLRQKREALRFPRFETSEQLLKKKRSKSAWISPKSFIQWFMIWLVWICVVTAAASPQLVGEPEKQVKTARSFMIAADISFSMANSDWDVDGEKLTRWDGVKEVMQTFIDKREGDRLGLIFFGTNAYLQVPLTTNHDVVKYMLDQTEVGMAGQMTSIGKAIGYASKVFKQDTIDQKVVLILTDGQDGGEGITPLDAARLANGDSIKIYTIGIGEPSSAGDGLDEETLKEIAKIGGGEYFLAQDNEQLYKAYEELNRLEPIEYEDEEFKPTTLLYHYPLSIAIILSFLLILIRSIFNLLNKRSND